MNRDSAVLIDFQYMGKQTDLFESEISAFRKAGIDFKMACCRTEDEIITEAAEADYILCCGNPPVTRDVISGLPRGKAFVRYGIGVNSIDMAAATEYGKIVYFMPGFCFEELAMAASGMILALQRNLKYFDRRVCKGEWPKGTGRKPKRMSNLVIGLFGFGNSAQALAKIIGAGYGSRIIACDPYIDAKKAKEFDVEAVSFDELLKQSDVISIHAPLSADTRHIFNREAFRKMKNDSFIINISRGSLICESDLIEALQEGQIAGAGLDVLEKEPPELTNPLLSMDNVILTPHTSFYGSESLDTQHRLAAELPIDLLNGMIRKKNVANKEVLDKLDGYILT